MCSSDLEVLDLPIGEIAPGRLGDLVALDLGHPSLHPPNALMKNVVYALSPQAITDVWVHGRHVVEGGRITTLDETELLRDVRDLTRGWGEAVISGSPDRSAEA